MHKFHRFVFPPSIDFDDALDVLPLHGYSLHDMEYAAEGLYIRTYKKGSTVANVVTDETVDVTYIAFSKFSKDVANIIEEIGALDSKAALALTKDLLDFRLPYYLTMSSNKGFNADIFHFIKEGLAHSDPQMRHHTLASLVYLVGLGWKEKIERLLNDTLLHETVKENKMAAEEVLKALNKNSWNESNP